MRKVLLKCKLQLEETVNEKNRFSRLKRAVAESEKALSDTIEAIFTSLSQVTASFDSAATITNRVLQHHQRRIDVYWRSAMRHLPDLPALPNVTFTNNSEQEFAKHYEQVVQRAEKAPSYPGI